MATAHPTTHLHPFAAAGESLYRMRLLQRYRHTFGHEPQLRPPRTFNEHITDKLLNDRDPRLKLICDKRAAKGFVAGRLGPGSAVPLLGAWRSVDDVEWDRLPQSFILKPNQRSGFHHIVEDKRQLDLPALVNEARGWQHDPLFVELNREWGYQGIEKWLIAEPLIRAADGGPAPEVDIFTFNGRTALIRLLTGRKVVGERRDAWFDVGGRQLELRIASVLVARQSLSDDLRRRLIAIGDAAAAGFGDLRVDVIIGPDRPLVMELTPYSWGGRARWTDPAMDTWVGRLWDAPDTSFIPDFKG